MEEEYNWNLILKVAIPIALIEAYIFYANIIVGWQRFSLILGLLLTGVIIYMKDKKKSSIFTGVAIVFLITLIVMLLKKFGVF